jgi:uncharacterized protein (DUF1800 family)
VGGALLLEACGGSSSGGSAAPTPITPVYKITETAAARFLAQATMGSSNADINHLRLLGYDDWLTEQFVTARSGAFYDWIVAAVATAGLGVTQANAWDAAVWRQLISGGDQLRQRVGMALLNMLVVGIDSLSTGYRAYAMAAYADILWDNAFGNFRDILQKISTNVAMGLFLTFLGNIKANPATGAIPDENYARELMQLFTIGLYQLNPDGSQKLSGGKPIETYAQDDVSGLARVFTGWNYINNDNSTPDRMRAAMLQTAANQELGAKTFLGTTIPAGTDGVTSLKLALDAIFAHANVAPFVGKQLIQRLVTSNPSPAYIGRVSAAFENNGSGVRGDMKAVIRAILTDSEARDDATAASSSNFGKLREPVMRLTAWARAFGATSPSDAWLIGDLSSPYTKLAESPGRSQSVFNFFRPGYVPPDTALATANLVAPEFQITNEPSVVSYINLMITMITGGSNDFKATISDLTAEAGTSATLIADINLRLAANQLSAATIAAIKTAVDAIGGATLTATDLQNRVYTAILLTLASPEFIVMK